ncbi:MAG: hypothetical protein SOS93_03480 [Mannheimia varigena]|nr:hypothetical protein [Mannheimia varigena]
MTASVSSSPASTLIILFPPLSKPSLVKLTVFPAAPLEIVTPVVFKTVSPVVNEPFAPKLTFSANLIVKVSAPSASTPIFPSVNVSVAPPLIF